MGAILNDTQWCLRIPKECVYTLTQHNLLNIYCVEFHNNYYLKPEGFNNEAIMTILTNTPVIPDG